MNIINETATKMARELVASEGQGEFNRIDECEPLLALAQHYLALAESHKRLLAAARDAVWFGVEDMVAMKDHDELEKAIEAAEKL